MDFNTYLNKHFPGLTLCPPIFYKFPIGIRFELGNPDQVSGLVIHTQSGKVEKSAESDYLDQVYFRSKTLFKALHSLDDDLFIVVNVHRHGCSFKKKIRKVKIFNHYVKRKEILFKLKHFVIPYVFQDVHEIYDETTHRYILPCKVSDINYISLLEAIANQDMNIEPLIYDDVFFVNITRNTIFHIYDDRGCDVIASSKEALSDLYMRYNDWILDYDRKKIDMVFMS